MYEMFGQFKLIKYFLGLKHMAVTKSQREIRVIKMRSTASEGKKNTNKRWEFLNKERNFVNKFGCFRTDVEQAYQLECRH
jgi:hypothetical protein